MRKTCNICRFFELMKRRTKTLELQSVRERHRTTGYESFNWLWWDVMEQSGETTAFAVCYAATYEECTADSFTSVTAFMTLFCAVMANWPTGTFGMIDMWFVNDVSVRFLRFWQNNFWPSFALGLPSKSTRPSYSDRDRFVCRFNRHYHPMSPALQTLASVVRKCVLLICYK